MTLDPHEFQKRYRDSLTEDISFETLFYGNDFTSNDLRNPIPKIAHFVYVNTEPLNWINYLAIKGALVNLRVEKVKIWIPHDAELEGEIWQLVGALEGVEFYPIRIPGTVYGFKIPDSAGQMDVIKLKVLYEEGGITLENDLVPLKNMDHYFNTTMTRPTIMAERIAPEGLPNWLIISKPKSPFLRRWMEEYAEDKDLSSLATDTPLELLKQRDPHLEVMNGRTWFYPLASDMNSDRSLKMLWFGKSWDDIDESFGTHVWHWKEDFRALINPETVREIDTPLFCRLRGLFDGVDGKKGKKGGWRKDRNCDVVETVELDPGDHGLFADYVTSKDKHPIKMMDSSGHNLHGWAPNGTATTPVGWRTDIRSFTEGDYAVLPVPRNFDARVFTAEFTLRIDPETFARPGGNATFLTLRLARVDGKGDGGGLQGAGEVQLAFKSRAAQGMDRVAGLGPRDEAYQRVKRGLAPDEEEEGEAEEVEGGGVVEGGAEEGEEEEVEEEEEAIEEVEQVSDDDGTPSQISDLALSLRWIPEASPSQPSTSTEKLTYTSPPKLSALALSPSSSSGTPLSVLTISLDRARNGTLSIYLDGEFITSDPVPLLRTPRFVDDVWVNALGWDVLDAGFRGDVARMRFWAESVPAGNFTEFMSGVRGGGRGGGWRGHAGGGWGKGAGGWVGSGAGRAASKWGAGGAVRAAGLGAGGGSYEGGDYVVGFLLLFVVVLLLGRFWGRARREVVELGRWGSEGVGGIMEKLK